MTDTTQSLDRDKQEDDSQVLEWLNTKKDVRRYLFAQAFGTMAAVAFKLELEEGINISPDIITSKAISYADAAIDMLFDAASDATYLTSKD